MPNSPSSKSASAPYLRLAVAIPSYRRGQIALDTLHALLALAEPADELLLVDQTLDHSVEVALALQALHDAGQIRWIRLPEPSIPHAMNVGLLEATTDVVLFLDDDIIPDPALVAAHRQAQGEGDAALVAGQVLQPGQQTETLGYRNFKHPLRAVCAVARGGASVGLAWLGAPSQSVWAG